MPDLSWIVAADHWLFALINGSPDAIGWSLQLPILIARYSWVIDVGLLAWVWDVAEDQERVDVILCVCAVLLCIVINYLIHQFCYLPRPGEMGVGNVLAKHQFTARFPSNHGAGTLAAALPLLNQRRFRAVALVLAATGLATCWSRVYLGIHMPFDMLGAALVAVLATLTVRQASGFVRRHIVSRLSLRYDAPRR